jgi:hypothetical protein
MVSEIQGSYSDNYEDYYQMYHCVIWYIFTNIIWNMLPSYLTCTLNMAQQIHLKHW